MSVGKLEVEMRWKRIRIRRKPGWMLWVAYLMISFQHNKR
jgi:hypothetical protein